MIFLYFFSFFPCFFCSRAEPFLLPSRRTKHALLRVAISLALISIAIAGARGSLLLGSGDAYNGESLLPVDLIIRSRTGSRGLGPAAATPASSTPRGGRSTLASSVWCALDRLWPATPWAVASLVTAAAAFVAAVFYLAAAAAARRGDPPVESAAAPHGAQRPQAIALSILVSFLSAAFAELGIRSEQPKVSATLTLISASTGGGGKGGCVPRSSISLCMLCSLLCAWAGRHLEGCELS